MQDPDNKLSEMSEEEAKKHVDAQADMMVKAFAQYEHERRAMAKEEKAKLKRDKARAQRKKMKKHRKKFK